MYRQLKAFQFVAYLLPCVFAGAQYPGPPATIPVRSLSTGHADGIYSLAFTRDGRTLASGSQDKTIKLWDVATGREVRTLIGHTDMVDSGLQPGRSYLGLC